MKRRMRLLSFVAATCILCMIFSGLVGCGVQQGDRGSGAAGQVAIKQSPDKYTWYVKSYTGSNLANVGYISLAGDLRDTYGASNVKIVPVSVDGSYIDVSNEEALKEYAVISQNIKPNTEVKLEFDVDENGKESEYSVDSSSMDSIVLLVKKVGGSDKASFDIPLTEINACPGPEVRYVQDYVGRNLAAAGYISLAGDLRDTYGKGNIKLVPVADDGSFIDTKDIEVLKQYRVVSQNVEPNTEITFVFDPEHTTFAQSQSLQEIELKVTKVS